MPAIPKYKTDSVGKRIPRRLREVFHAGSRVEQAFDKIEMQIRRVFASPDLYLLRDAPCDIRRELEIILAKRRSRLPYVTCQVCREFEAANQCYCRGTGWLTLDEYLQILRDHPEACTKFDSKDVAWMIPRPVSAPLRPWRRS